MAFSENGRFFCLMLNSLLSCLSSKKNAATQWIGVVAAPSIFASGVAFYIFYMKHSKAKWTQISINSKLMPWGLLID